MNKEILIKAIEVYGFNGQADMAIEEMAELTKAICKHRRAGGTPYTLENLIEEVADVKIMIAQLELMLGTLEVAKQVDYKLNRLQESFASNNNER